ncbi:unnamed protein product [Rotaria magnacalcarata]|uniref:Uncharacterized protein n=1 Tax=Rotaria magnacalcarata TaxID=392030 RepID=A0A816PI53_9BILA|nr:unnamed protein product [Rotaria magnacalcarata]CAF2049513.1 unnamed protein product [Rotaria magnacalcarata]
MVPTDDSRKDSFMSFDSVNFNLTLTYYANHDFIVSSQEELNSKSFAVEDAETIPSDQIQLIVLKSIRPSKSVATSVYTNEADFDDQVLQAQQLRAPQLALLPRLPQQVQQPLQIIVRSQRIYFGFYGDDTQSTQTVYANTWYHMAYICDYSTLTQYVYVNGVLDGKNSVRGPY